MNFLAKALAIAELRFTVLYLRTVKIKISKRTATAKVFLRAVKLQFTRLSNNRGRSPFLYLPTVQSTGLQSLH